MDSSGRPLGAPLLRSAPDAISVSVPLWRGGLLRDGSGAADRAVRNYQ